MAISRLRTALCLSVLVLSARAWAAAPTVTTDAATALEASEATLNGTANPGGADSTGYFRYGTYNSICRDTYGTRAPATGGAALGSGTSAVSYSQTITGLSPATQYYYCAAATNADGTSFGAMGSFMTAGAPLVSTGSANSISASSAALWGTVVPRGKETTLWFRYSTVSPGTCDDTFGTRIGGYSAGSGWGGSGWGQGVYGLAPGTTYYYCIIASNSVGISFGSLVSFTTLAAPTVGTESATSVTPSSALLGGSANPRGASTTGWFRYSTVNPGVCNDTFGTRTPPTGGSALGSGTSAAPYSQAITGLAPVTTFYYCAIASNSVGTSYGAVLSFTTPAAVAPTVTSEAATGVSSGAATLNGTGNPGGADTTGWFRYATVSPGTCNDSFGTRAPATGGAALGSGTSSQGYSQLVSGLSPGVTYYSCAIAMSSMGTSFGAVLSFTTAPAAPTVSTSAATSITATTAQLAGSAIPNGAGTTGWFRYGTTSPGTCSDSWGTRAPASAFSDATLGAGTSAVAYSRAITGLTPGTTYYSCAIATNSAGLSFGAVLSFTTPAAPPTVTTAAASLLTATSAQLNGSGNPGGASATGWFRYATVSPGTCNDTFGTRAPASGGTALGSGAIAVAYSHALSALSPGTTYYFCAIASSSAGTALGAVLSFTTPAVPPTVTTVSGTVSTGTIATMTASVNPNGASTTGYFRYSLSDPGTCDDTFGTRAPAAGGTALGSGTSVMYYSQVLSGLSPGTTYYFCALATSSGGTAFGAVLSFTTFAAPAVTTTAATGVARNGATLSGAANPGGASSTGWFRYATVSPGTCNDSFGTRAPASGGAALGSGTSAVAYSQAITGLAPGTTYYSCAIAANAEGMSFGAVLSFTTLAVPPVVTTTAATGVASNGATLDGTTNPGGASSTGWFRYATVSPGSCNDTFGTRAPAAGGSALGAGTSTVPFSESVTGLSPGTTYSFCAIAANAEGMSFGAVLSFTTPAVPPTASTSAATTLTGTTAQLEGAATPGGAATAGFFRYDTADPGTCNDTFGTRAPAAGGSALGAGTSSVPFSEGVTGLAPGATYYFCAIATSSEGTAFGAVQTFTTLAVSPTVATAPATGVDSAGATLNGSASPGGAATTGFFRYDTADPGTCNDSFGTRAPGATGGTALGAGTSSVPFSEDVTGLAPGATYYFCAIASNAAGTSFGAVGSFTTAAAPAVATEAATAVTSAAATLNGSAVPNRAETTGWFRIDTVDPGVCNDAFGTRAPGTGGSALGAGTSSAAFSEDVSGLSPGTTYHYCAIAENAAGKRFGDLLALTAGAAAPAVTTAAPTGVTNDSAVLNGSAVPNGDASTGWFRYATVDPGVCDDAFGTRTPSTGGSALGAGTQPVAFSAALAGLARGAVHYYCAIAENAQGTSFGAVQVAVPGTTSPVVTTGAAAAIDGSGATLAGSADPNGNAATGWFRYGDVAPTSCDDSFGTRAPAIGGASLGAGATPVPFEQAIAGLEPNLTYYYCAAASNLGGATFGEVRSFVTAPLPPVVATLTADVGANAAVTLAGLANPRGAETTTWFRVGTTDPGSCDDTFGTRWPQVGGTAVGAGRANVHYNEVADGLPPGRYFACAIGSNAAGPSFGELVTFDVPQPSAPGGGGCGCRTDSPSGGGAPAVLALLALLLAAPLRRRRA